MVDCYSNIMRIFMHNNGSDLLGHQVEGGKKMENTSNQAIVQGQNSQNIDRVVSATGEIDLFSEIERRNKFFEKLMSVAIQSTTHLDWMDQSGKPYLENSGSEKIARRFGISTQIVEPTIEWFDDVKGRYYVFTTKGKAWLPRGIGSTVDEVEEIGTASSRDDFFGKSDGEWKPIELVDITDIKKKCYTNCFGRLIRKLLGLNGLTWDFLESHGIKKEDCAGVSYRKKGQNSPTTSKPAATQSSSEKNSAPFWVSGNGKYLSARSGRHFPDEFLLGLGMRPSQYKQGEF